MTQTKFSKMAMVFLAFVITISVAFVPAVSAGCNGQTSPLCIQKDMPPQILIGKIYTYTIRVSNGSNGPVEDVSIIETLPATYSLGTATPEASKVTGQTVQWDLGTLKAKETKTIKISGTAKAVGSFESCTKVFHSQTLCQGPQLGMPAILLEVIDTEDPIQVDGMEKFYVTVTNQGNADDSNIVVKVDFEENLDYVASAGPTQGRSTNVKSVEFAPLATLAAGKKATWEVSAKAVKEGDHRTSVKLTSDAIQRSVDETEATRIY
ncbi:MAG: hypothetical protein V1882_06185 [Candidatus Omnitrophota bacterium]